jgi:riboflavin synthase
MGKIGIVDTAFSRIDLGKLAWDEIKRYPDVASERRTVPGIKDLAVECKKLLDDGCDLVIALGITGGEPTDLICAHEAGLGIQQVKLMAGKHVIEVFVYENEAWNSLDLVEICACRIRKQVRNAVLLVSDPSALMHDAGIRPGEDEELSVLGIVVARFNETITFRMRSKALQIAEEQGVRAKVILVPGVYDMPLAVKRLLMDKRVIGVATLGAVVKGDTSHDEVITKDAARRFGNLSLDYRKPVSLGIIGHGVDWEAAEARAEDYAERAVLAVLEMIEALR